jgi:hypothetical protein
VPAILITLNTFAAEVFYCILCPLIVIWPLTDGIFLKSLITKKEEPGQWKGDFILLEDEDMFKQLTMETSESRLPSYCWYRCLMSSSKKESGEDC